MNLEDFWALIQGSSTATRTRRERTEWLTENLARLPVPVIIEFELHLAAQRKRVDTWLTPAVGQVPDSPRRRR